MGERIEYKGSLVLVEFSEESLPRKFAFTDHSFKHQPVQSVCRPSQLVFLRKNNGFIDSPRNEKLLRSIFRRVSRVQKEAIVEIFDELTTERNPLLVEAIENFESKKQSVASLDVLERIDDESFWMQMVDAANLQKKILKLELMKRVLAMKRTMKLSLRRIAHELRLPFGTVCHYWDQIRKSAGDILVALAAEINAKLTSQVQLHQFFEREKSNPAFANMCLRSRQAHFDATAPDCPQIPASQFYDRHMRFGFKYKAIKYTGKFSKELSKEHVVSFLNVYLYFLIYANHFELIFLDESSVAPSNFKKRRWEFPEERAYLRTSIKYERIMLLGAMNREQIVALQFLHSNFGSKIFLNFVQATVKRVLENQNERRQIVLFLDNCPSHRSQDLIKFCRSNNIILLFNLPKMSQFNPIEYLWEYLKRPLRKLTDYYKLIK